jgi:putative SOS response-associated peptidase YedK
MLTVNADAHPLMRHFHKPQDEKRMVVVLPEDRYGDWLEATAAQSASFLTLYPAQDLVTQAPEPPEAAPGLF